MDLSIMLWVGGMIFSLGIFAIKVGLGLGYGKIEKEWAAFTLGGYTALFMVIAVAAKHLMLIVAPLLAKGPYMHILLAVGLITWGSIVILRGSRTQECCPAGHEKTSLGAPLLLIIPCPVCLSAMTFSTWAALNAVKLPPLLVGLGLGAAFAIMTLLVMLFAGGRTSERPETSLGLAMIIIGIYFVASLFLPAKIDAAKGMYASFIAENKAATGHDGICVMLFMMVLLLVGYFAGRNRRNCQ